MAELELAFIVLGECEGASGHETIWTVHNACASRAPEAAPNERWGMVTSRVTRVSESALSICR